MPRVSIQRWGVHKFRDGTYNSLIGLFSYPTNGTGGLFTLVAFDPDMPNRNNSVYSEFLHWLVVNIPDEEVERGVHPSSSLLRSVPHRFSLVCTDLHRIQFVL